MRDRNNWYDSDNPSTVVRGGTWRGMLWVAAIVAFVVIISSALWALGVFASPVKGKGDAFKQKNSADNWVGAQARFEDLYADILATDRKIDPAKEAMAANPGSQIKATEYTGLVNYCMDVVGDYNAEARKYLSEDFRSADLPPQIDDMDPATDCKPSDPR